jgi:hypothetical protein
MKPFYLAVLMLATSVVAITAPDSDAKKIAVPRLTQVDAFPEKYRDAVRAIGSALSSGGGKPGEYFAEFLGEKDGLWEFHLKHQSHPVDDSQWMGDACSRCRVAFYDPKAGKFLKFQGIK